MKTQEKIKKLAEDYWEGCHGCDANDKYFFIKGFEGAYRQCQQDMADKKYTEEDIKKAIELARETESVRRGALSEDWDDIEKYDEMDIIYLLNKQD